MTSCRKITREELQILCNFNLSIARELIAWNENIQRNFVTTLLLKMVRKKIPTHIKQAILTSGITPKLHSNFEDIKDIPITYKDSASNKWVTMKFTDFYDEYLYDLPQKSIYHRDGTPVSNKAHMEKKARNSTRVLVGNCEECRDTCGLIWAECNLQIRQKFNLPLFDDFELPLMEQVECDIFDHCFNIVNRDPSSDLSSMEDWIEDGKEVMIVDLWGNRNQPLSVNEQLELPNEKRDPLFEKIRILIKHKADKINIITTHVLGEGHTKRWLDKQKDPYYFIHCKYPNVFPVQKTTGRCHCKFSFADHSQNTTNQNSYNNGNDTYVSRGRSRPY